MEVVRLNSEEDIQKAINDFYTLPRQYRMLRAKVINDRLKELNAFIKVDFDNPILNYPLESERFIIKYDKYNAENEYVKYEEILKGDREEFNRIVYNDIDLATDSISVMHEIKTICAVKNHKADRIYEDCYFGGGKSFLEILQLAVNKILKFYMTGSVEDIVKTSLDDIEFIIASNILTDHHIRRHLLPVMKIKDISPFKNSVDESINRRLVALFNTQISLVKQRVDDFMLFKTFNVESLEAYLKIQKMTYEETLVNSEIDNDYERKVISYNKNPRELIRMCQKYSPNATTEIKQIDLFRLNKNGFEDIKNIKYKDKEYKLYLKENSQYMIMKSTKKKDVYYLIGENMNHTITLKNRQPLDSASMDVIIESAFSNIMKKNGK